MSISNFFADVLGAPLRNQQWSWGAIDPVTNRVFLRVWKDEIESQDGGERVLVLRKTPRLVSNGYPERQSQIRMISEGAEGFGVVCTARDTSTTGKREIKSFDESTLLRLGTFADNSEGTFAIISGRVPVEELVRSHNTQVNVAEDLAAIVAKRNISETTRIALINARLGQGSFRADVLKLWNHRCAVTGSSTVDAIRASHIKAWRESSNEERLDPYNGLPLVASLDALFDIGYVSFEDSGKILVSPQLRPTERRIFNVTGGALRKKPPDETVVYLRFHRDCVFRH